MTTAAPLSPRRRWAALSVLVGAVLLLAIDSTVLYLAVPSLTRDLAPSGTQVLWIGDIYSLAACNEIGHRRLTDMLDEFALVKVVHISSPPQENS